MQYHQKKYFYIHSSNINAFTLIELIVVITILVILGTIAFLSLSGYSNYAKNGKRISDMRTIERALNMTGELDNGFPLPDNLQTITFSGATLWFQGTFGQEAQREIRRITSIPLDPVYEVEYSYAVSASRRIFQIASIKAGGIFSHTPQLIPQSYAYTKAGIVSQTLGSFFGYDIVVRIGNIYNIIAVPSIMLSDIPSGNALQNNQIYNFVYNNSEHLPESYSGVLTDLTTSTGFQTRIVFSGEKISTLEELELYIAQLSTSYQSLAGTQKYENLIFNSHTQDFKRSIVSSLEAQGVIIEQSVKNIVENPPILREIQDSFIGIDGTNIVGDHTPDVGIGNWELLIGTDINAYQISSGTAQKTNNSNTVIHLIPTPLYQSADYAVSFDIIDFSGGSIEVFLRYIDSDNYYKLEITNTGYILSRVLDGTSLILQDINEAVSLNSNIVFSILGDTLNLIIESEEKENLVIPGINDIGTHGIYLENTGARIDNFILQYR